MVTPSLNTLKPSSTSTIKFLCSYGGRILPRYPDAKLRYHGGHTRLLSVERSISFAELLVKVGELCGTSVTLRCQLPTEDLDALVSITSDEDLANLIEEYDRAASSKIKAFLSPLKSTKKVSPPPSIASSSIDATSSKSSPYSSSATAAFSAAPSSSRSRVADRCFRQIPPPVPFPICYEKSGGKLPYCAYHAPRGSPSHMYLIHNGNHWQ
ncbi:uncharacterized protein LOC132304266 [Cornus florida]|uniref:uncharacterized protein LOC132304266 n=1 Tax=Cornus florida TaxID=4283 RepID=UPI00289D4F52|nr:uncharacterized protein LOC132304266 [Cornus florida]XP_059657844.1 uncharacterized protein LOC132304266 [Cornus florida]